MEQAPSKYSFKKVSPTAKPAEAGATTTVDPAAVKAANAQIVSPEPQPVARHTPAISGNNVPTDTSPAPYERRSAAAYADDSDNIGVKDIIMPRLNIVQKVGDLSNQFTEGDILFNRELVLLHSAKTREKTERDHLRIVVCGFRKDRYAEKTTGGDQGDIVDTEEQVFTKGATTDYNEAKATKKKLYQILAECLILIEKPEGIEDPAFKYHISGKAYAPALWAQKGTAYTNGTKYIRTARKGGWLSDEYNPDGTLKIKRSYGHGIWELRAELKDFSGNFAWVPNLRRGDYTSPEMQTFAASILG